MSSKNAPPASFGHQTAGCVPPPRMDPALREEVAPLCRPVEFAPGQALYLQDNRPEGLYLILSGRVKVIQILADGTETVLAFFTGGNMVGEVSALSGAMAWPSAVALTKMQALLMPTDRARALLRENGEFAAFLTDCLVHKLRIVSRQFGVTAGRRVQGRLAVLLPYLAAHGIPQDKAGWFAVSQEDVAGLIGTTRPNASALLKDFARLGLIETGRGRLRILDPDGLRAIAEGE